MLEHLKMIVWSQIQTILLLPFDEVQEIINQVHFNVINDKKNILTYSYHIQISYQIYVNNLDLLTL